MRTLNIIVLSKSIHLKVSCFDTWPLFQLERLWWTSPKWKFCPPTVSFSWCSPFKVIFIYPINDASAMRRDPGLAMSSPKVRRAGPMPVASRRSAFEPRNRVGLDPPFCLRHCSFPTPALSPCFSPLLCFFGGHQPFLRFWGVFWKEESVERLGPRSLVSSTALGFPSPEPTYWRPRRLTPRVVRGTKTKLAATFIGLS